MFINYTKRFIYLRVPKTGSTSLQSHLINTSKDDEVIYTGVIYTQTPAKGVPDDLSTHCTLKDILYHNLVTDLNSFNVYGVIRDPIDRFASQLRHDLFHGRSRQFESAQKHIADTFNRLPNREHQTHWLRYSGNPIQNIYRYEDIQRLAVDLTGESLQLQYRSEYRSNYSSFDLSDGDKAFLVNYYKDDLELYHSIKL